MTPESREAGKWYHYHKKLADSYAVKGVSWKVLSNHHRKQQAEFRVVILDEGWEEVLTDQRIIDEIYSENKSAPEVNKGTYGDRGNE